MLERRLVVEAVQKRGHPPREMLGAPDAAQRGCRIRLQRGFFTAFVESDQGARQDPDSGGGEMETLGAGRRHDMRRVAGEEEAPATHGLDHEAAHRDHCLVEDAALGELYPFAAPEPGMQFLPYAAVRPVVRGVVRI